jgi:RNA polymerase sigma factor (sigma-70 family)
MREDTRQVLLAALRSQCIDGTPENGLRAEEWAILFRLWGRYLSAVGTKWGLPREVMGDFRQSVFLAILRHRECFRGPEGAESLLALSRKLMHDKAVDEIRRRDRHRALSLDALPSEPMEHGSSESACLAEMKERREWLDAGLKELKRYNQEYYELLSALYLKGRSLEALAARTRCSVQAIKCRLTRARQALRRLMKDDLPGGGPRREGPPGCGK